MEEAQIKKGNSEDIEVKNCLGIAFNSVDDLNVIFILIEKGVNSFNLSNCQINDDVVEAICAYLKNNKTVKSIDFSNNKITSKGMQKIKELLKENFTLVDLRLEGQEEKKGKNRFSTYTKNLIAWNPTRATLLKDIEEDLQRNKIIQMRPHYKSIKEFSSEEKEIFLSRIFNLIQENPKENKLKRQKYQKNDPDGIQNGLQGIPGLSHSVIKLLNPKSGKEQWYVVENKPLGAGANGKVKLAYPLEYDKKGYKLGNSCVIKIAKPSGSELAILEEAKDAFIKESNTVQDLNKDFTVYRNDRTYYDQLSQKDCPKHYMTQPLGNGKSLRSFIQEGYFKYMPFEERLGIITQLWKKLADIHEEGIVHRDIKSENILFDPKTKRITIIDYGSSEKVITGDKKMLYMTEGLTPQYAAPEIYNIDDPKRTWATSSQDVFALGLVTAEILNSSQNDPEYEDEFDYYAKNPVFSIRVKYFFIEEMANQPCVLKDLYHSLLMPENKEEQTESIDNILKITCSADKKEGICRPSAAEIYALFKARTCSIIEYCSTEKHQNFLKEIEEHCRKAGEAVPGFKDFLDCFNDLIDVYKLNNRQESAVKIEKVKIAIIQRIYFLLQKNPDHFKDSLVDEINRGEKGMLGNNEINQLLESIFNSQSPVMGFFSVDSNTDTTLKNWINRAVGKFKTKIESENEQKAALINFDC